MKRTVKNIVGGAFLTSAILASVACQQIDELPTVSFEKANEVIDADNEAQVKVVLSEAASADLTIPFTVTSTSKQSDAYTISAESFSIKAGESEGSVVVRNNGVEPQASNLTLRLGDVPGYKAGMNPQIVVALGAAEKIIWSFQKPKARLVENSTITVTVSIAGELSGDKLVTNREVVLPVSVAQGSTAVEGEDFELSAKEIRIPAGDRSGSITLSSIKPVDAGTVKTLELSLSSDSPLFMAGAVNKMNVSIVEGTFLDDFSGKWAFSKDLHTEDDDLGMIGMVELELGTAIPFPVCSENDMFEVAYDDGTESYIFTPSMTGDLSRYFRECTVSSPVVVTVKHPVSYAEYEVNEVNFSKVNFDFAQTDSDIKQAKAYISVKDNEAELFMFCSDDSREVYKKNYELHSDFGGNLEYDGQKLKDSWAGVIFTLHYKFVRVE